MSTVPIVALDVPNATAALSLIDELGDACSFYKIGAELFTAEGPAMVREIRSRGADVFLDLKYHDIPNTVAAAVRSAARLGVRLLTIHATGGDAMLSAAARAAAEFERCQVYAVTILTSLKAVDVATIWMREDSLSLATEVTRLAIMARDAGTTGVVCSGHEAALIKDCLGSSFGVLVPGVRLEGGAAHDQSRTVTPHEAAAAGADYIVVGRAVTAASDRRAAMREVCRQLR